MEYRVNGNLKDGPISDNFVFTPNDIAKRSWKTVGMQIAAGKLVTEIRQYLSRCARAPPGSCQVRMGRAMWALASMCAHPVLGTWSFSMGA